MRRLLLVGVVLSLVCVAGGSAARPSLKAIAAARERAAAHEAQVLLRRIVVPHSATRIARMPRGSTNHLPSITPWERFVRRTAYWRVHGGTLSSVTASIFRAVNRGDEPFVSTPSSTALAGYREFNAEEPTRDFELVVLRHAGTIYIRVRIDVLWVYPRSPREAVPAAVGEIDVTAPKISRQVTDPTEVARIVRMFDHLPVSPPGRGLECPLVRGPNLLLVFRTANGTRLASASVPTIARAWVCDPIRFAIHGHSQMPLVDRAEGNDFAHRVGKLLGVKLG